MTSTCVFLLGLENYDDIIKTHIDKDIIFFFVPSVIHAKIHKKIAPIYSIKNQKKKNLPKLVVISFSNIKKLQKNEELYKLASEFYIYPSFLKHHTISNVKSIILFTQEFSNATMITYICKKLEISEIKSKFLFEDVIIDENLKTYKIKLHIK